MSDSWVRHDPVAVFYGGYDQVALRPSARRAVSKLGVAIALAALTLLVLVAADVSAYASIPPVVRVTSVDWYTDGALVATSPGFTLRASQETVFPLVCTISCLPWGGASVSSPFELVGFSVVQEAVQYTNLTVRAPASAYDGPLAISLVTA
jgi:hypothetical protein